MIDARIFVAFCAASTIACGGAGSAASGADAAHAVPWSYAGNDGPEHWGDLATAFAACKSGKDQSPIDLQAKAAPDKTPAPIFGYTPVPLRVSDNGHTISVDAKGTSSLTFADVRYELRQFHLHTPAEHTIDGKRFDAELHLVHESAQGKKLVVAFLFTKGKDNTTLAPVFAALPKDAPKEDPSISMDLSLLLPAKPHFFHYAGSLTAPPCSEGVEWLVVAPDAPLELSDAQITAFQSATHGATSRPIQSANGRAAKLVE